MLTFIYIVILFIFTAFLITLHQTILSIPWLIQMLFDLHHNYLLFVKYAKAYKRTTKTKDGIETTSYVIRRQPQYEIDELHMKWIQNYMFFCCVFIILILLF